MKQLVAFLAFLTMACSAFAQNQGDETPLGSGGTSIFCNTNPSLTATASAGELNFPACSTAGELLISSGVATTSIGKAEDAASATGGVGVLGLFVREDALTANTGTSGDYTWGKTDGSGRLIVTNAPPGESFTSCSSAATGTTDVAIKAAVASNRIYVTSISCVNTSSVTTELEIRDATTVMDIGFTASNALGGGGWQKIYPVPLRGTANTALNLRPVTTASSTRCCAQGYISTQ